jgi:predicted metal-binding membrane protein
MTSTAASGRTAGAGAFYTAAAALFCLCAAATAYFCASMSGTMPMPGGWRMSMMWMRMPGQSWAGAAAMFLAMWTAMMVAMMLPSLLGKLGRSYRTMRLAGFSDPGRAVALVAAGYFLVWTLVGLGVYALGLPWALATMRWPALSGRVPALTAACLMASGAYQFSAMKDRGLVLCRRPLALEPLAGGNHVPRAGLAGPWFEGLRQGYCCIVCCAGPMVVLLALGAMNVPLMVVLAALIAAEKLAPDPGWVVKIAGWSGLAAGLAMLARLALQGP